ncbi:hypothetical protein DFP72DRAFT_1077931 [Ephemerocybe angulata]|uniref:NADP-dependent oxidoreductase domain-containing protein n=1 Tax=Ephemerocybe angulata TaxID=980116 RepID=A0A8H6HEX4_9AGAR|nr:hypothetical protein DFP72DRAFT_1077931 [Tulosesus angulatus]
MSIGDKCHEYGMGLMPKEESFDLVDVYYYDLGGNIIDMAIFYQHENSEQLIGEWAEVRGVRDQLFLATKRVMYGSNNAKSMHLAIESSLRNGLHRPILRTLVELRTRLTLSFWRAKSFTLYVRGHIPYLGICISSV